MSLSAGNVARKRKTTEAKEEKSSILVLGPFLLYFSGNTHAAMLRATVPYELRYQAEQGQG